MCRDVAERVLAQCLDGKVPDVLPRELLQDACAPALFGTFTILGALAPSFWPLVICRFIAGLGLGAEQPLAFAYAGEYAPKAIRGRILAIVHFIGGAMVWPIGTALVGHADPQTFKLGFGLLLMVFPYFVTNVIAMVAVAAVLLGLLWLALRLGW